MGVNFARRFTSEVVVSDTVYIVMSQESCAYDLYSLVSSVALILFVKKVGISPEFQ